MYFNRVHATIHFTKRRNFMNTICHENKLFVFQNTANEQKDMFLARCWFIAKNYKTFLNDTETLENLSYLYVNSKYYGVEYDTKIMDTLHALNTS